VVVPVFDDAESIAAFLAALRPVLERSVASWTVLFVNDGSRDDTLARILAERTQDARIAVLDLARNFGKEAALSAGLDRTRARAVVPMDVDLQDPPDLIEDFVARWRDGFDVVYARRASRRGDGWCKRFTARAFYRIYNRFSSVAVPVDVGDYRLMDQRVIDVLRAMPERARFLKGMYAWAGFRQCAVDFQRSERHSGQSKWRWRALFGYAVDGLISFSAVPLRLWTVLGLSVAIGTLGYAGWLVLRTLIYGRDVPGYASLMVGVLFMNALVLISVGVLGEYIARIYEEVKARPLYVVRDFHPSRAAERAGADDTGDTGDAS